MNKLERRYDVALSFAGEDRPYVEQVAAALKESNVRVFYDAYEEASLWGKNLYTHLSDVYKNQAIYTIIFISNSYVKKLWTNHERESAQARAFEDSKEYILPARFDDSDVPGIMKTVGYVDLRTKTPLQICKIIQEKLKNVDTFASKGPRFVDLGTRDPLDLKNEGPSIDDQYARISIRLFQAKSRDHFETVIGVDPIQYSAIWELLNDLYYNVLHQYVSPMSYGSEWLLVSGNFSDSILVPTEWITAPGCAIYEIDSENWLATPLTQLGITERSCWEVVENQQVEKRNIIARDQQRCLFKSASQYFLVASNRPEIMDIIRGEPKSPYVLHSEGLLRKVSKSNFDEKSYEYKILFRDWIGGLCSPEGDIFVDTGENLDGLKEYFFRR